MRAYELALGVLGVALPGATAESPELASPMGVRVYVRGAVLVTRAELRTAEATAGTLFTRMNVRITWIEGKPAVADASNSEVVLLVRFQREPRETCSSQALAYAKPFLKGRKTITVLLDRIRRVASGTCSEQCVLGYILAHEIAHTLQRTTDHAATGVMKAAWDRQDNIAMASGLLDFTPADVELIRVGLNTPSPATSSNEKVSSSHSRRPALKVALHGLTQHRELHLPDRRLHRSHSL